MKPLNILHFKKLYAAAVILLLSSCNPQSRPIEYGTDNCVYCDMTIMDHRYGTEIVTDKGKVYTFDSIECLVDFLDKKLPEGEGAHLILLTPFTKPIQLVNADESYVLFSLGLPSPMGMYLTAFDDVQSAETAKAQYGGRVFTWEELLNEFQHLDPSLLK